jgi:small subunit ribosomal protein S2
MAIISMKELLETGVHFGHRTRKWNPKMKPFIFTERNNIHIIDLQQTLEALEIAFGLVRDIVADGGTILFVGTKRQAQESIEIEATRCHMPYVNSRWLGGTLTNWRTIQSRIDELEGLERRRDAGEFELLTKKEALTMTRRIEKLEERLGGIREMKIVPDAIFVVDVKREETAVHEANLLKIPVIALVDTNCDPGGVDYVIPSNDDAIRAIKLLTGKIADAALEGVAMRKDKEEEMPAGEALEMQIGLDVERTDEELLGEATLAKLKTGDFGEEEGKEGEPESESIEIESEAIAKQETTETEPDESAVASDEVTSAEEGTQEEPEVEG